MMLRTTVSSLELFKRVCKVTQIGWRTIWFANCGLEISSPLQRLLVDEIDDDGSGMSWVVGTRIEDLN